MAHSPDPGPDPGFSLLFPGSPAAEPAMAEPESLRDVNLDQLVAEVAIGTRADSVRSWYWTPLGEPGQIRARQEVCADLDRGEVRTPLMRFSRALDLVGEALGRAQGAVIEPPPTGPPTAGARKRAPRDRTPEAARIMLNAVLRYGSAVSELVTELAELDLHSDGMIRARDWLVDHVGQGEFPQMMAQARSVSAALRAIRYELVIDEDVVTVREPGSGTDLTAELAELLGRFGPLPQPESEPASSGGRLDPVALAIRERVAARHAEQFAALATFADRYRDFIDPQIVRLDQEAHFYLLYLALADRVRSMGLPMCYPEIRTDGTGVSLGAGYDLALAASVVGQGVQVITNDLHVAAGEWLLVLTGPNQGGKTTFARMYAQVHWLASLGLLVPGSHGALAPIDQLLTHFDRAEQFADQRGKLADDLHRMAALLARATPRSLVILNEVFASTSLVDAIAASRRVLAVLGQRGTRTLCVTFIDELSQFDSATVSLVAGESSGGDPQDPDGELRRTFKVSRRPADGLADARAIAARHRVTRDEIKARIGADRRQGQEVGS